MYSNTITYRPSQLFYSQDSIKHTFKDGQPLDEFLSDLLKSPTPQELLPPVKVMVYDGKPFVIDGNRRLFLMKKLENAGLVGSIKVEITQYNPYYFNKKHTTKNEGLFIKIRSDRYRSMEQKIDNIIKQHKREKYQDQNYERLPQSSRHNASDETPYSGFISSYCAPQRYNGADRESKLERNSTNETNQPESSDYGVTNRMVKEMASQRGTASDTRVSGLKPFIGASQRHHGAARESKPERNSTNETNQPESFDHGGMASQRDTATGERKVSSLIKMFNNLISSRSVTTAK